MERKQFLKSLSVLAVSFPAIIDSCKKSDAAIPGQDLVTNPGTPNENCIVAPTKTAGPFPTKSPASYVRSNITEGRSGYPLDIDIKIGNTNNSCTALAGALVDIWHCDAEGNYSEYGATQMQSANYQNVHFLRGRQTTDTEGMARFASIFPGWYQGRATHIHVHIFNAAGNSLKITQIAFPEGAGSAVALVNGYSKGMRGYTYNAADNVFSDDRAGIQIAEVTGSLSGGFSLSIQLNVPA